MMHPIFADFGFGNVKTRPQENGEISKLTPRRRRGGWMPSV
jgi:hypothetical protein